MVIDLAAVASIVMMSATAPIEIVGAHAQGTFALADLTVPADRLPDGCGLSPSPSIRIGDSQVRGGLWAGLPITRNPWIGTDRAIIASIHERVIDPPPIPDGPPPTKNELARFRLRLADGVEEAYVAVYAGGGPSLVTVNALRYADASQLPSSPGSGRLRPGALRFTGRTALAVSGDDDACLQAVVAHVRQVAGR